MLRALDCSNYSGIAGRHTTGALVDSAFGLALRWTDPGLYHQLFSGMAIDDAKNWRSTTQNILAQKDILKTIFLLVCVLGFGFAQHQAAPDFTMYDTVSLLGAGLALIGAAIIAYYPRA